MSYIEVLDGQEIMKVSGSVTVTTKEGKSYTIYDKWLLIALSEFLWNRNEEARLLNYPDHISEMRGE